MYCSSETFNVNLFLKIQNLRNTRFKITHAAIRDFSSVAGAVDGLGYPEN